MIRSGDNGYVTTAEPAQFNLQHFLSFDQHDTELLNLEHNRRFWVLDLEHMVNKTDGQNLPWLNSEKTEGSDSQWKRPKQSMPIKEKLEEACA